MRLPLAVLICAVAVTGISSGNTTFCDAYLNTMGCTSWGWKDDGTMTGTIVVNRLNCTDSNAAFLTMPWAMRGARSPDFSVRTGNGATAGDVAFYHPGEYMTIYVRALAYKKRYRGLLLYAQNAAGVPVGRFEFPQESEAVPFWAPPAWESVCSTSKGGTGNAALHKNADDKPYTVLFRWKAPAAGTGLVTFKALFKNGPANHGYFYYPERDLTLSERNPTVDGAIPPLIWFKATSTGQTCASVCTANGNRGVDTDAMATLTNGGEGMAAMTPSASEAFSRSFLCRNPPVSSCTTDFVPAVDAENFCLYHAVTCPSWRQTTAEAGRLRLCACTTTTVPPPPCPADNTLGWPQTNPGATATKNCPSGQTGSMSRPCSASGTWGVVVDTCVTPATCTDGIQNQGELGIDCGAPCPKNCSQCGGVDCGAHGTCVEATPPACQCNSSYTGDRCETPPPDPCATWECSPAGVFPVHGTCTIVLPANTPYCACNTPYEGLHCENMIAPTCSDGIQNQNEVGVDCGGPCPQPCASFFWDVSTWTDCSKTCGGGMRTRGQTCKDSTGAARPNGDCAGIHEPITQETCNPDPCPVYSWVAGAWENCTTTCGGGIQIRPVDCWSNVGPSIVTQPGLCPDSLKPMTQQSCNTGGCTGARWVTELWNACDRECGGGKQTRVIRCMNGNTETDPVQCTQPQPPLEQACNIFACTSYSWFMCPAWGPCTATCNGGDGMLGQQYRDLYCVDNFNKVADYSLCDVTTKPLNVLTVCNTQKCSYFNWMANGDWSQCNGTYRTRSFHCHAADGSLAKNSDCAPVPLPLGVIPCTPGEVTCPPLITPAPTPFLSAAPSMRHGLLPLVMAVASTFLFSPRLSSCSVMMLMLFSLVAPTEAHNWLHTPGRASFQASTIAPCQGRKDSDLHAQVGPDQRFTIKFATGHERDSYFVTVAGDQAEWLAHDDFEAMVDDYIAKGPDDHTGVYTRRYHGFASGSRGSEYSSTTQLPGKLYSGPITPGTNGYPAHSRSPSAGMWIYTDTAILKDKRVSYSSTTYPWIVSAARYEHFFHLPDDFDAFHWTIPSRITTYGHYIVHWRWSGYYDCIDVDYRAAAVTYVDGQVNASQHTWSRVDHCQYEQPKEVVTHCMEVVTDVQGCINALNQGDWNMNYRYGLNVVPFRNPASANPAFAGNVGIPWRDGACSSSWNRLKGTISESAVNWGAWDARTTVQTGKGCNDYSEESWTLDLKRAVAFCVGLGPSKCVALAWEKPQGATDVHRGEYHFRYCRSSTDVFTDVDWNMYIAPANTPATYDLTGAWTTINFAMSWRLPTTPTPGVVSDAGDPVSNKNGYNYGWNCNVSMGFDYDWVCRSCPGSGVAGCCNREIDYTFLYDLAGFCPQYYKVRRYWNIDVPSGVYEVQTRHYGWDGGDVDVWGCNVENTRMIPTDNYPSPAGTQLTQRVEVADGKLTLNGDGQVDGGCNAINWLKFRKIGNPGTWDQTWMPAALTNPTWEQDVGTPMPIGIVSFRNVRYSNDGDPVCSSWWLFKGSACYPSRPYGWFNDTATQGAIVGVSNTSCLGGSCPGAFFECGTVSRVNAYESDHYVDCNGKIGRYVWVRLPGASRHLVAEIDASRFVPDVPAGDNPLVCYAVEARAQTTTSPEYVISLDPEDPIFYSTCWVRNPDIKWLSTGQTSNPDRWRFNGRCISCESFQQNRNVPYKAIPKPWVIDDGKCTKCDKETAPIPPPALNWIHSTSQSCDDPATDANARTWRNLTSCAGAPFTSCTKDVRARGRTGDEPNWGSEALSLAECLAVSANDPECSSAVEYYQNPDGWMVCRCHRKHPCCGKCTSETWEPNPSSDYMAHIQVYDFNHDPVPDPYCTRGLKSPNGKLCCPIGCKNPAGVNVCGAAAWGTAGCRAAAGGGQCCHPDPAVSPGIVVQLCADAGAPCRLP